MNKSTHIIHKQTIEVSMPPGKSPFAIQEKIRQVYYDKILTGLDELFSELVTGDVIIRLDRLDIELGFIDGERLEQELVEKTILTAQKLLKEKLQFGTTGGQGMDVIPIEKSTADLLLYFLEYGRLPWWSRVGDLGRLETGIMEKGTMSAGFRAKFLALMEEVPTARQRLLFQFSGPFLQFILSACFPVTASGSEEDCVTWFKAFYGDAGNMERKEKEKRAGEKDKAPGEGYTGMKESGPEKTGRRKSHRPTGPDETIAGPHETIAGSSERPMSETERMTRDNKTLPGNAETDADPEEQHPIKRDRAKGRKNKPGETASPDENALGASGSERPETNDKANNNYSTPVVSRSRENEPQSPETGPGNLNDNKLRISKEEQAPGAKPPYPGNKRYSRSPQDDKEPIYAELAGLVILQPFLAEFFTALHLLEGKNFRDEVSRNKAVFLLGYLATGSAEIQEHRLVFPKVLCGMELATPIERTGILTPEEMEEAESLLTTVISYWKALKSTTTDGLRDSFLQREGKLSRKDEGWQLDVEKKTLDILLGKLPWGFSIIRLPWMKEMIFVSWG